MAKDTREPAPETTERKMTPEQIERRERTTLERTAEKMFFNSSRSNGN